MTTSAPDPYRTRKRVGLALWLFLQAIGGGIFLLFNIVGPLLMENPGQAFLAMAIGAAIAFPAMCVYLTLPRLLDRYDPEPLYALLLALTWGAGGAYGFAALVNTIVGAVAGSIFGADIGDAVMAIVSAPLVEEGLKGLMILGIFYFLKQEFDGVVDGIIYGTFAAIGFAATENVIYYAQALVEHEATGLAVSVVVRGFLSPWGHPLYTSMTGIGIGLAREAESKVVRYLAPFAGYAIAVFLHATWNGLATLVGPSAFLLLPLWFLFVLAFVVIVAVLVRRRGRIIRDHLLDEVALGNLSQAELDLVVSAFGGLRAYFRKGRNGTAFVRAVARLGLDKWHVARAMRGKTSTVSMDFIIPLRAQIAQLRATGASPV